MEKLSMNFNQEDLPKPRPKSQNNNHHSSNSSSCLDSFQNSILSSSNQFKSIYSEYNDSQLLSQNNSVKSAHHHYALSSSPDITDKINLINMRLTRKANHIKQVIIDEIKDSSRHLQHVLSTSRPTTAPSYSSPYSTRDILNPTIGISPKESLRIYLKDHEDITTNGSSDIKEKNMKSNQRMFHTPLAEERIKKASKVYRHIIKISSNSNKDNDNCHHGDHVLPSRPAWRDATSYSNNLNITMNKNVNDLYNHSKVIHSTKSSTLFYKLLCEKSNGSTHLHNHDSNSRPSTVSVSTVSNLVQQSTPKLPLTTTIDKSSSSSSGSSVNNHHKHINTTSHEILQSHIPSSIPTIIPQTNRSQASNISTEEHSSRSILGIPSLPIIHPSSSTFSTLVSATSNHNIAGMQSVGVDLSQYIEIGRSKYILLLEELHEVANAIQIHDLLELSTLRHPNPSIEVIVGYIGLIIGIKGNWKECKKYVFRDLRGLKTFLQKIDPTIMTIDKLYNLDKYMQEKLLPLIDLYKPINSLTYSVNILLRWVLSYHSLIKLYLIGYKSKTHSSSASNSRRNSKRFTTLSYLSDSLVNHSIQSNPTHTESSIDKSTVVNSRNNINMGTVVSHAMDSNGKSLSQRILLSRQSSLGFDELINILAEDDSSTNSNTKKLNKSKSTTTTTTTTTTKAIDHNKSRNTNKGREADTIKNDQLQKGETNQHKERYQADHLYEESLNWFFLFLRWRLDSHHNNLSAILSKYILPVAIKVHKSRSSSNNNNNIHSSKKQNSNSNIPIHSIDSNMNNHSFGGLNHSISRSSSIKSINNDL